MHPLSFGLIIIVALCGVPITASYFPGGDFLVGKPFTVDKRTAPAESSDGRCYTYVLQNNDKCSSLATTYDITVADIEKYNKNTWGWNGCDGTYQGSIICLSPGSPPMPVALPMATCGPQVPGTARPSDMSHASLASLNPCSGSKCCLIGGLCGSLSVDCESSDCISNCESKSSGSGDTDTTTSSTSTKSTSTTSTTSTTTSSPSATSTTQWEVDIYEEASCEAGDGGYFIIGGYNENFKEECWTIANMSTDTSGPDPYCLWYTDGGSTGPLSCSQSSLTQPKSWTIKSGSGCNVYYNDKCSIMAGYFTNVADKSKTCQNKDTTSFEPNWFVALECAYL